MNQEYVLLGGFLWRFLGKRVALWYNHTSGTFLTRLAMTLAHYVFHTSPYAYTAGSRKSVRMPAGIDTDLFYKVDGVEKKKYSVLYLGRLSPVKRVETLIRACTMLHKEGMEIELSIYGSVAGGLEEYKQLLENEARELIQSGKAHFYGSVLHDKTAAIYTCHTVVVNLTASGNYDKTVLEAMACQTLSVVSSEAFADVLSEEYRFREGDVEDLSRLLQRIFALSPEVYFQEGRRVREYVVKNHNIDNLAKSLRKYLI